MSAKRPKRFCKTADAGPNPPGRALSADDELHVGDLVYVLSLDCTAKVAQDASIKAHQAKGSPVDVRVGSLRVSIPWDGLRYIGKDGSNPPPKKNHSSAF